MIHQETIDMLVGKKMTAMTVELFSQLQATSFNELSFEDRLRLPVRMELPPDQQVKQLIYNACCTASTAEVEAIPYYEDRKLDRA